MALMATGARFGFAKALPFVAGVALGKQLIIWPLGFGLAEIATASPEIFTVMKYLAAAYIVWLAWRIAGLRLSTADQDGQAPGFIAGLIVHPLNPKAWAMIIAAFTSFVPPDTNTLSATALVASVLLACQLVLHPLWTFAGDRIAKFLTGTTYEIYLMRTLAALTVLSVILVLFAGE